MAKIDNDKMWASLLSNFENVEDAYLCSCIRKALKEQGLEYNPETECFENIKVKEEKPIPAYYVCVNNVERFSQGCIYESHIDDQGCEWITDDAGHSFIYGYYNHHFRPASQEETAEGLYNDIVSRMKKVED